MSLVKIRILHENGGAADRERTFVKTVYVERVSHKKLTARDAGRLLANTFLDFDTYGTRKGLAKSEEGFYASRTIKPLEKCDYQYFWEYAIVTEETE